MNALDRLPARLRYWIYAVLGTLFTIESTLDAFQAGLVPERPQGIAIAVLSALGFGLAFRNTPGTPWPPPPNPGPQLAGRRLVR